MLNVQAFSNVYVLPSPGGWHRINGNTHLHRYLVISSSIPSPGGTVHPGGIPRLIDSTN